MRTKNNHHGESASSRADKMSGANSRQYKLGCIGKQFFNRKRRMFLKNPLFYEKI